MIAAAPSIVTVVPPAPLLSPLDPADPVPAHVRAAFAESDRYFPTAIQRFQFFDKYSRFDDTKGRRETWIETVDRAVAFLHELVITNATADLGSATYDRIRQAILHMRSMPSMRLLSMAGPAARRDNATVYNCTYLPVESIDAFCEALLLTMAGCGVGYSVERRWVDQLPAVKPQLRLQQRSYHLVEDTAEGWAAALRVGLEQWFAGEDPVFDLRALRPAGAPLRTKGGRASGPEPLRHMLTFVRTRILARQGQRLRPIDAHDLMCMVGQGAISGGVRRMAMLALFDHDDVEMRECKNADDVWETNPQRGNANNSAVWPADGLAQETIVDLVDEMVVGQRGEPGIFNRKAVQDLMPARRMRGDINQFGINPCGEIQLKNWQMCNLSIAVARAEDTLENLLDKVEVAAIIGTIQSLATHFPNLRPIWKQTCEEERLLGVDITGQMDCPATWDAQTMQALRAHAVETNRVWAARLGINQSTAVTCVKPSGNSAQLLDCSSGIHPRWSHYYVRNARVSATSPVYKVLRDAGVPMDAENGQTEDGATTLVVHFPVKAPDGAITRQDKSAIEQCGYWLHNKLNYTEHNPSVTITYRPEEVDALKAWILAHRDLIGGMAFLPAFDAKYQQMPYEEITGEEYERQAAAFPTIDFARLYLHEHDDRTTAAQELACSSGTCSIDGVAGI